MIGIIVANLITMQCKARLHNGSSHFYFCMFSLLRLEQAMYLYLPVYKMSNAEVAVWYELEFYLLSVHSTTVFPFHKCAERMLLLQTSFHESCIFGNRGNDRTSFLTTNNVLTTFEKIQKLMQSNTAIQSPSRSS